MTTTTTMIGIPNGTADIKGGQDDTAAKGNRDLGKPKTGRRSKARKKYPVKKIKGLK